MQTLLRPSDHPNDSKRTLFRELGTSTVRFTVHGKMLTMSIDMRYSYTGHILYVFHGSLVGTLKINIILSFSPPGWWARKFWLCAKTSRILGSSNCSTDHDYVSWMRKIPGSRTTHKFQTWLFTIYLIMGHREIKEIQQQQQQHHELPRARSMRVSGSGRQQTHSTGAPPPSPPPPPPNTLTTAPKSSLQKHGSNLTNN